MRYQNFLGLMPKTEPAALDASHAQVAVNLLIDGHTLTGLHAPGHPEQLYTDSGAHFIGTPATILKSGGIWVGFPEHTFFAKDTQGAINYGSFLFVKNQKLHWQSAERLLQGLAPVAVGTCAPTVAPAAVVLAGMGCQEAHPDLSCVTDPLAPGGVCLPETPIWREYVCTFVRQYPGCEGREEESAPSPPTEVQCLDSDAPSLTCQALPTGVTSVRWYRSVVSTDGRVVLLYAGETAGRTFVDMGCTHSLGGPIRTLHHYPPPGCVDGVANLGDALVLVWHKKTFWTSQPFKPYAFDTDRDEFKIAYGIVGIFGQTARMEGSETYKAQVVTTGHPYRITGSNGAVVDVKEHDEHHPCISVQSIFPNNGSIIYASAYGLVDFTGERVEVLTDAYMTSEQWRALRANDMRVGIWDNRIMMAFPDRDGLLLTVDGPRPKSLVSHTVRAHCFYTSADIDLHLATTRGQVWRWGTGQPMKWTWVGPREVQAGLWKPSSAKVVSSVMWQWHDVDEELLAYNEWKCTHPGFDKDTYFAEHPSAMHLRAQIDGGFCHTVTVFANGRPVYTREVKNARPFRLPRITRATNWAVGVSGYGVVSEVHLQTSLMDLSQDGGHA
jgi:hypothetical protein